MMPSNNSSRLLVYSRISQTNRYQRTFSPLFSNIDDFDLLLQGDFDRSVPVSGPLSHPLSRNCLDENEGIGSSTESELAKLRQELTHSNILRSSGNGQPNSFSHNISSSPASSYAAALGSLPRSNMLDPVIARAPSPCLAPIGGDRVTAAEKRSMSCFHPLDNLSCTHIESANLSTALSGLDLSTDDAVDEEKILKPQTEINGDNNNQKSLFGLQGTCSHAKQPYLKKVASRKLKFDGESEVSKISSAGHHIEKSADSGAAPKSLYMKGLPTSPSNGGGTSSVQYQLVGCPNSPLYNHGLSGFTVQSVLPGQLGMGILPPLCENHGM